MNLYPFQLKAVDALRRNIKKGVRRQILCSPTGSGKTVCAMEIVRSAQMKGKRSIFVCDRQTLVNQTSKRFDQFGILHGVTMGDYTRGRSNNTQVASAQTLEKRKFWFTGDRKPDLVVIDEAHEIRKGIVEYVKEHNLVTIGMSATPLTPGLADIYEDVVNVTSTVQLIKEEYLAPLHVVAAQAEVDVDGVKVTSTGEWDREQLSDRVRYIVGDVVAEWEHHTTEQFGGPEKTIVFGASVADCEDLARQFQEAGYDFRVLHYKQSVEEKQEIITGFERGLHMGLISCVILTKGFDVPSVRCMVDAYPLRKSLSMHIQKLGRVMRTAPGKSHGLLIDHCIHSDQRVLTHRGLKPICKVTKNDLLWDGEQWVRHQGAVRIGHRRVLTYAGLTATSDHRVWTRSGWMAFGEAARRQAEIAQTGAGRAGIRLSENRFTNNREFRTERRQKGPRTLRVPEMRVQVNHLSLESSKWSNRRMSILQSASAQLSEVVIRSIAFSEAALRKPERSWVPQLWWTWNQVSFPVSGRSLPVDRREYRHTGPQIGTRSKGQSGPLRTWEPEVCKTQDERGKPSENELDGEDACFQTETSGSSIRGRYAEAAFVDGVDGGGDSTPLDSSVEETEGEVWDILAAGPRNRFTCEGLLVHNCGNYTGFMDQANRFFQEGVSVLPTTKPKARKSKPRFQGDSKCKSCGYVYQVLDPREARPTHCPACGAPRQSFGRPKMTVMPGKLEEIAKVDGDLADGIFDGSVDLWTEISCNAMLVAGGEYDKARRIAYAQFKGVTGAWPRGEFMPPDRAPITAVRDLCLREYRRWKRQRKVA